MLARFSLLGKKKDKDAAPSLTSPTSQQSPEKKSEKAEMRNKVLKEILDTERSYIDSLRVMVDIYLRPLGDFRILAEVDFQVIFSNINTLYTLNQRFLSDLQVHMKYADSKQRIGGLFLEFAPFFKMYSHYVQNHETASRIHVEQYQTNKKYKTFCDEASANERCRGLNLASLLIMPIQRIPRYKLLAESLVKYTPEIYDDYLDLSRASELLKHVATHINEEVRLQENRNIIRGIQKQFSENPLFLQPGRLFIKQGELMKQDKAEGSKGQKLEFFLFNNSLAFAKKNRSGVFKLVANIAIDSSFTVSWVNSHTDKIGEKSKKAIADHAFVVNSSSQAFIVTPDSKIQADEWYQAIQQSMKLQKEMETFDIKNTSRLEAKGLWQDSTLVNSCMVCDALFTLFRRKHHCRQCGNVVCDGCCVKKELKSETGDREAKSELSRVCQTCYELLRSLEEPTSAAQSSMKAGPSPPREPTSPTSPISPTSASSASSPLSPTRQSRTNSVSTISTPSRLESRIGDGKEGALPVKILRQPIVSIKSWIRESNSTIYVIEIASPEFKKPIHKKYKEFYQFDQQLKKKYAKLKTTHSLNVVTDDAPKKSASPSKSTHPPEPETTDGSEMEDNYGDTLPNIPPQKKRILGSYNPVPEVLEKRRVSFQLWLRLLFRAFKSDPLLRKDVADWLGVDVVVLTSRKDDSGCLIM